MMRSPPEYFPRLKHDHLALKLNGKDDRLTTKDFRTFASTARLKAANSEDVIEKTIAQVRHAVDKGNRHIPRLADYGPTGKQMSEQMLELIRSRVKNF